MFKRYAAVFTIVFFTITMFPLGFIQKAYAYQNNAYFNDVKIGLVTMSASSLSITLNGDYTINGQVYPSGSVFNLGINGTSITFNGTLQTQMNLTPNDKANLLTVTCGSVSNKYMGSFLFKLYNNKILPINMLDIESYLKGVVGYEMSDNFPIDALKAQAVAARNYALSRIGYEAAKGYDFDDTTGYQVYKGYNPNYKNVISSVEQTKGQVLLYNDKLVEALYSAWHGGVSENSENVWGNYVPYLRSVQDSYESDPWPNGNRVLTNAQIQSTLVSKGYLASTDTFLNLDLNSITKFASGRISNINIIYKDSTGTVQTKSVTKDNTRTFLSLPSNLYTVTYDSVSGSYTFTGKGNGHGLGMSQIGAKNRAAAGQTYDQILKFYYQGTYLQNIILKATLSTLAQSSSAVFTGTSVSFNSTASGGNGYGYLYKYIVKNGSTVVTTQDYSISSTLNFTPNISGTYSVEAYVKDKYSISDYDDKKVASLAVYDAPVLNSFTLSRAETLVNQTITASADIQKGSGSYLYKYEVSKDGTVLASRDFSTDKQFSYIPLASGSYTVTTYIRDSISINPYDLKQSQSFTAYDSLAVTSLTKDVQNVFAGDTVNFNTAVSGGSNKGVAYRYIVIKDGQTLYTGDFSAGSQFTYVTKDAGNYEVDVNVLDAVSSSAYDAASSITFSVKARPSIAALTLDKASTFVNDTITMNASGTTSDSLYKYVISKDGQVVFTKDYAANSSLQFVPSVSGSFQVQVYTKDSLSTADYDDTKAAQFQVYDYSQLASASGDKSELFKNDTVHFSANGTKGSGSYLYKFTITKDGTVVASQDYSSANTFDFIPSAEGSYTASIYIKDALSQKDYDDVNNINFTVLQDVKITTVQTNKPQYLAGQTMTLNASSTSGSGSYLYKFIISKDGTVLNTVDYSASASLQYTFASSGSYTITLFTKDVLSSKDYDDSQAINIQVFDVPAMTYTSSTVSTLVNTAVNYTISETNGSGSAQYRFTVTKDNVLISDSGYLSSNTFSFIPSAAGAYQITGYLKDALSESSCDAQSTLNLTVYAPQLTTVNTSGYFYEGKILDLTANSTGSSPLSLSYRYEIYLSGNLVASNSFSSSNAFSFTPGSAGSYTVKVYGKDGLSQNAYDCSKQFNITINSKPLYLSTLPLSYGMTNNDVVSLQNALIKLGYSLSGATGYFGTQTKSAVISFQSSRGLSADGIVGSITYKALNDALIEKSGIKNVIY